MHNFVHLEAFGEGAAGANDEAGHALLSQRKPLARRTLFDQELMIVAGRAVRTPRPFASQTPQTSIDCQRDCRLVSDRPE